MYTPPFTITAKAINLIAEISAQVERFAIRMEQEDSLRLRKVNRMQTIRGTLAIEGNTLTLRETDFVLRGLTIDQKPLKDHMEAVGHKEAFDFVRVKYKSVDDELFTWSHPA